ncbi:TIM barrel protein [Phenylobacterium sp.]|uniref:TIM barrel protein n=1 Tax=Phenylobacterium sp. TaxID=1871053 RepID=UPI0025E02282|nr:TIM barrel protein [Phenylobacterium sp.]MCA3716608.1 TIM barrel protein [Phenylobacterium sp.]
MIRQSFAWWSFAMDPATDPRALLAGAAGAGAQGVEMLPDDLWPVAQDLGLTIVTLSGHALETGFNDPSRHAALRDEVRRRIDDAAAGGCEAVIVFSGSRIGDGADAPAIAACVEGLGPVVEHAKAAGVRLLLELLNSKVDHPGHQCDRTAFGAAVVRQLDDPGLRLLYDGYHMQLMEGDLSRTITDHLDLIGHVHTAGAPGRHDLDDRQEINWRAIAGLLARKGYGQWVGHEFVPRGEPVAALAQAIALFNAGAEAGVRNV